jgi:hypothetical protein
VKQQLEKKRKETCEASAGKLEVRKIGKLKQEKLPERKYVKI